MKLISIYIILFASIICKQPNTDFEKVMTDLENLEKYIRDYMDEYSYKEKTLTHLIVCYIRLGAYTTQEWTIAGGELPDNLTTYIADKDKEYETTAQATQTYREIEMPNKDINDFVHMFAVMNGIEHGNSYSSNFAHLVGWGGDTEQLLENIMASTGDLESLMEIAKTNYFRIKGGFDEPDLIADLDGVILLYKKNDDNNFADLMRHYYNSDEYKNRVTEFVKLTFPGLNDTELFRETLFKIYSEDIFIKILECNAGLREKGSFGCYLPGNILEKYADHQKAAVYVVSDYFSEYFEPSITTDSAESDSTESDKEKTDQPSTDETDSDSTESDEQKTDHIKSDETDSDSTKSDHNSYGKNLKFYPFWIFILFLLF